MEFKRYWDATCPKVWDSWEKDGVQWWIQDIPPEDEELVVKILLEHYIPDEAMFMAARILEDPASLKFIGEVWLQDLKQRMSLACYTYVNGEKTLVGLSLLVVKWLGEEDVMVTEGNQFPTLRHVIDSVRYSESGVDDFKYYGVDKLLYCSGFVVRRDFRGQKLGGKLMDAWEPLCKHFGITASSAVFTSPAAQKLAASRGFETLAVVTYKQLAECGLNYPLDETKVMKFMSKRYE